MEKSMELKELTDKTLELFGVTSPEQLGPALLAACGNPDKLRFDEGRKLEYRKTEEGIWMEL